MTTPLPRVEANPAPADPPRSTLLPFPGASPWASAARRKPGSSVDDVTGLLSRWEDGEAEALDELMPAVTAELHRMATRHMSRERGDHTLQPTAVVNEVYLRLAREQEVQWNNRAHFFAFAAQLMRRILIDYARIRSAEKRLSGVKPLPLDEARGAAVSPDEELLALHEALDRLADIDRRQCRVVELHFFVGLNFAEIGEVLGISATTVKRDWRAARLWLFDEVYGSG